MLPPFFSERKPAFSVEIAFSITTGPVNLKDLPASRCLHTTRALRHAGNRGHFRALVNHEIHLFV